MHPGRHQPRPRMCTSTLFMITMLVSVAFIVVLYQLQYTYFNRDNFTTRCITELASLKYQLDSVLEFKRSMDSVITETQQENVKLKQSIKDLHDSYLLMKHHHEICEMQSEDLEAECKGLKQKLLSAETEITSCKKPPG